MKSAKKENYRIFLSSPGDVNFERNIVRQEVQSIFDEPDIAVPFKCEIISWDDPGNSSPLLANQTPQTTLRRQLVEPADCDLVIVIFWSRMGTPLPTGQFKKANGEPYYSGTEWEFENALNSPSKPNILLYRRIDLINLDPDSADYDSSLQQQGLVNQFFKRFVMDDGSLKGLYQKYKGPSQFREQLAQDLNGILKLSIAEGTASSDKIHQIKHKPLWQINPYVGLRAYGEQHAEVFFGREREILRMEEKVVNKISCVAVVGSSGVGKSSLVLAGLVPRLKKSSALGGEYFSCNITQPLNSNFLTDFSDAKTPQDISDVVNELLAKNPNLSRLVLVVDQAEEVLKLADDTIKTFMIILNGLIQCPRVTLILTCRSDLYSDFLGVTGAEFQTYLQENTFILSAPRTAEMIDIIRKPAQAAGIVVEDAVIGKILENFEHNRNALPLISYLLGKLYDTVGDKQVFDLQAFDTAGGVEGVVKTSAEQVYNRLRPSESAKFSDVFARLLSIDNFDRVTREHCALATFQHDPDMEALIASFVKARLLTITEDDTGISSVEIAHESLIYNWPSLAALVQTQSSQIKWLQGLREGALRWRNSGKANARVIQGDELDQALLVLRNDDIKLESEELEFLDASSHRRLDIEKKIKLFGLLPAGMIIISVLIVIIMTAQNYYDVVDRMKNQNVTVSQDLLTSIALTVAPYMGSLSDLPIIDTIVNANIGKGNYHSIIIKDNIGNILVEKSLNVDYNSNWLSNFISIPPVVFRSEINHGWNIAGTVSLALRTGPIYVALEKGLIKSSLTIGLFLILYLTSYVFLLRFLRQFRESIS